MPTIIPRRTAFTALFLCAWLLPLMAAGAPITGQPGSLPIRLQSGEFDPLRTAPERVVADARLLKRSPAPRKSDYYIVQFTGPIHESDKRAVTDLGAELLNYIPEFAFIARMSPAAAADAQHLPQVRWVGLYQPAFRVQRELYDKHLRGEALLGDPEIEVVILVFPGENPHGVANAVRAVGGQVRGLSETRWRGKVRASINAGRLTALANLPEVSWIERAPVWELHNEIATTAGVMDVEALHGLGFYGSSQIVAIADTQLDTGISATYVNDFRRCSGTSPRVTISQLGSAFSDTNGHGTHVTGSVLGNGRLDGSTCGDYAGHPAGAAPEAQGYFQGVMNTDGSLNGIPGDLNDLFQPAHDFGARIHTNSWGAPVLSAYTASSEEADQFLWDNPDFLIFFSNGNSGRDIDADGVIDLAAVGAPATAKNVMSVGASENPGQGGGSWNTWYTPVPPLQGDPFTDDVDGLAAFSSRGPTDDGRVKPDIAAPGIFVNSVASTVGPDAPADYVLFAGTSMATPLTAGAAAVAREAFAAMHGRAPSGPLLKALLANGATDMYPGQYGTSATREITMTRPSMQAGWGRVHLENTLIPVHELAFWDDAGGLNTGQTHSRDFEVHSSAPLSATLAWMDYPGLPMAFGALTNDLDIKLEGPGGTHYANNAAQREAATVVDPTAAGFTHFNTILNNHKRATLMQTALPTAQPAMVKLWFYNDATGGAGSVPLDVVLYDNDGPGGAPGTMLCTVSGKRAAWPAVTGGSFFPAVVQLDACPEITTQDFFVSVEFTGNPTGGRGLLMREDFSGLSWQNTSSGWSQDSQFTYGWATVIYDPVSPATPFDRINNLVGIDLASPPAGSYTLTVNGYNVPHGPQPYALVLRGDFTLISPLEADLAVAKVNGTDYVKIGGMVNYTVSVTNNGPEDVTGATVTDNLPASLSCTWTCVAGGGGSCTAGPVAGDISDTVDLPAGATATYDLACDVDGGASGTLVNMASTAVPGGMADPVSANDSATDSDDLTVCGEAGDLVLESQTVTGAETFTACDSLHAGSGFIIANGADVQLEAGESVGFGNGFRVEVGGVMAARVDPALAGT